MVRILLLYTPGLIRLIVMAGGQAITRFVKRMGQEIPVTFLVIQLVIVVEIVNNRIMRRAFYFLHK